MIINARQYAIAENRMTKCISLRRQLLHRVQRASDVNKAQQEIDDLQREAEHITRQMKEYVALSSRRMSAPDLSTVCSLPNNLIRARIALGWSQKEFARQFAVTAAQIHRWESSHYKSIHLSRALAIAALLNSALKEQSDPMRIANDTLKLGADWFGEDFRQLSD